MRRLIIALVTTLTLVGTGVSTARAHAKLDHCTPAPGSAVATSPSEVRCWFTEEIDDKQSTLAVSDGTGARVDSNDGKVDLNDPDHKQIFATLKPLTTGVYKVTWHTVTPDDQGTSDGTWYFGVGSVAVPTSESRASSGTTPEATPVSPGTPAAAPPNPTSISTVVALAQVTATVPPGTTAVVTGTVPLPAVAPTFEGTPALPPGATPPPGAASAAPSGIPLVVLGGVVEAIVVIGILFTLYRQRP